jgi:hypothetical protein
MAETVLRVMQGDNNMVVTIPGDVNRIIKLD